MSTTLWKNGNIFSDVFRAARADSWQSVSDVRADVRAGCAVGCSFAAPGHEQIVLAGRSHLFDPAARRTLLGGCQDPQARQGVIALPFALQYTGNGTSRAPKGVRDFLAAETTLAIFADGKAGPMGKLGSAALLRHVQTMFGAQGAQEHVDLSADSEIDKGCLPCPLTIGADRSS